MQEREVQRPFYPAMRQGTWGPGPWNTHVPLEVFATPFPPTRTQPLSWSRGPTPHSHSQSPPQAAIGCCHSTSPSSRAAIGHRACIPHPPPLAVVSPSAGSCCAAWPGLDQALSALESPACAAKTPGPAAHPWQGIRRGPRS